MNAYADFFPDILIDCHNALHGAKAVPSAWGELWDNAAMRGASGMA